MYLLRNSRGALRAPTKIDDYIHTAEAAAAAAASGQFHFNFNVIRRYLTLFEAVRRHSTLFSSFVHVRFSKIGSHHMQCNNGFQAKHFRGMWPCTMVRR